ncbi:hypothetical protein TNCV_5124901 [Trichonephila clavipes]|nr:hypothetical protein TNCV_5124901 [Trichonephila clavipes]
MDPEEERLRIVKAAAAIIREDIESSVVETKSYPPPSSMLIKKYQNARARYGSERLIDVLYSLKFEASYAYGQYNGQACFNASRYESDLDADYTFDPEILQDLETNILDNENNENELEIFEGLEDNGEEEEKKINIHVRLFKIFVKTLHLRISIVIIV